MKTSNTAERLKEIMSTRKLKQIDILNLAAPFCKEYNVKLNKNDLSQYVSGKVEPGQHKLKILGLALDVNEAWLMGYDVPMSTSNKLGFRIHPNLNNGSPYITWTEPSLIEDYVNCEKAKENVVVIPCLDIDHVHSNCLDTMLHEVRQYMPLIMPTQAQGRFIYVINNTKYDDFNNLMCPLIEKNDMVLLDFDAKPENGNMVLIEHVPGKNFICQYYKSDDYIEFHFSSHKSIKILSTDDDYKNYEVRGIVKQVIKNIKEKEYYYNDNIKINKTYSLKTGYNLLLNYAYFGGKNQSFIKYKKHFEHYKNYYEQNVKLLSLLKNLNIEGQEEALKRINELTQLPDYKK